MTRFTTALVLAATILSGSAMAQVTPPVAASPGPSTTSPTGGIPPASGGAGERTGSITGVGQTKPPGDPVGERMGTTPELERKDQIINRKLESGGICKGC